MKRISITGIVATTIWLSFVVMGYQGIQGVIDQHAAGYPSAGQIRFYVIFPSVVVVAAALSVVCFWFGHLKVLASIVQVFSLAALFPYLFFYTGGM